MFERNTDRLFWTITAFLVAALLSIIMIKAYPKVAEHLFRPYSQETVYNITNPDNRPQPSKKQTYVVDKNTVPYVAASDQVASNYE